MNKRRNKKSKYYEVTWELVQRFRDGEYLSKEEMQLEYFPSKSELKLRRDKEVITYILNHVGEILLKDYGCNFGAIEGGENPRHGLVANKDVPAYGVYFLNNKAKRATTYAVNGIIVQKELQNKNILASGKMKINRLLSPKYLNGNYAKKKN